MQFNSLYFIIYFFPAVITGWYVINRVNRGAADLFLLAASFLFYAFASPVYALLLAGMIVVNYGIARRSQRDAKWGKQLLAAGILLNIALLVYFKYTNFLIENWNAVFRQDHAMRSIILPLGISFTVFTQISFLVDAYRGETGEVSLLDFALYTTFFPKLTQGPIVRYKDVTLQLQDTARRQFDAQRVCSGIMLFAIGLSKKIILADYFGKIVDTGMEYLSLTTAAEMHLVMLAYTLQIYFDFSGYSDMALATAQMLGVDLAPNFNSPYRATSVTDFWRRWHISLTSFLRRYVYFPLGGSRKGNVRTYLNIMIVFLVSGIWHGANWTFILWGVLHGLCQIWERFWKQLAEVTGFHRLLLWLQDKCKALHLGALCTLVKAAWTALCWCVTFVVINLLWLLFRSESLAVFKRTLLHLYLPSWYFNNYMGDVLRLPGARSLLSIVGLGSDENASLLSLALVFGGAMLLVLIPKNSNKRGYRTTVWNLILTIGLFLICMLSMSDVSSFIYNNF